MIRFRHEYETLCFLAKSESVIKPYSLNEHGSGLLLVMEDTGGLTLAEHVKTIKLSLDEFLSIAIRMTICLQEIHREGIVHRNINPKSFIYCHCCPK